VIGERRKKNLNCSYLEGPTMNFEGSAFLGGVGGMLIGLFGGIPIGLALERRRYHPDLIAVTMMAIPLGSAFIVCIAIGGPLGAGVVAGILAAGVTAFAYATINLPH
jgi:hypothetical protein